MTDSVDAFNEARDLLERVLESQEQCADSEGIASDVIEDIEMFLKQYTYREFDD